MESQGGFQDNMTNGTGFIALAALIFGRWRPWSAFAGAMLFGFTRALGTRLQILDVTIGDFSIPSEFWQSLPYVVTIIVVAGAVGRAVAAARPTASPTSGPDDERRGRRLGRAAGVGPRRRPSSAYAPYSGFPVGAAGLVDDGRVVVGCNVENASYGLTLCAECGLVSALHATGGGRLVAVAVTEPDGGDLACCGRCRQLLFEAGGPDLRGRTSGRCRELLPGAFGPDDLRVRRHGH